MSIPNAPEQLKSLVERIERLDEEIKSLNADKSDIYKEAKGHGFDVKVMRKVVAARRISEAERVETQAIFDLYMDAIDGRPLVRAREGE